MAKDIGTVNLISDGLTRTGLRKDGKGNYYAMTAYIDLGGLYPEKLEIFLNSEQEVLAKGAYAVPLTIRVYNARLYHDLDFKRAVSVNRNSAQPTAVKAN